LTFRRGETIVKKLVIAGAIALAPVAGPGMAQAQDTYVPFAGFYIAGGGGAGWALSSNPGVTTYTGKEALTREIARAAYERGARWVDVLTFDPWVKRQRLALAPEDSLEDVPQWMIDRLEWLSDEHAARITLNGPSAPTALDGIDPARAGRDLLPYLPNTHKVVDASTTNWCVAPGPTAGWARLVYPELDADAALDELWRAIAHVCRLDEPDPAQAWRDRAARLESIARTLTERRFDAIRLHGPGTDLTVGLFGSSAWHAADFVTVDGLRHFPNIPSEEMFTTPDPQRVDGVVTATRPLEVSGSVMDGIRVEFAGGRAVRIDAERGAEALRSIAASDDGASLLGELALVDGEGRIGPLGTVFYDTLLDENAASHIALGSAYSMGVEDAADKERINTSRIHVDFMIGSPEIAVDGLTADGTAVPLLRSGAWQV
jgi:aminopeptidase